MTKKRKDRGRPGERIPGPDAGAGKDAAGLPRQGEAAPEPARERRTLFDSVRENAEAFIVAVILAFIIRHFVIEAFEIPTGSMAGTLFGLHAWNTCPNCATEYAVALKSDQSTGLVNVEYQRHLVYDGPCGKSGCGMLLHLADGSRESGIVTCAASKTTFRGKPEGFRETSAKIAAARCPICHHVVDRTVFERKNKYGGDKILVTKFAYVLGDPHRWDVIVFEFDQWKNYIKRLVGLPGERINIWDGDLYVNGKVERKHARPRGNDALWTKISDSSVVEGGLNPIPAWKEVPPAGSGRELVPRKNAEWKPTVLRWSLNAVGDVAVLEYQRGFDNYYAYNLISEGGAGGVQGNPHGVQVGDKKVSFVARLETPPPPPPGVERRESWVGAEIRDGDFTFQLRLPVGSGTRDAVLERMSDEEEGSLPTPVRPAHPDGPRAAAPVPFRPGVPVAVEFENLDDRVAVRIDGREILSCEYTSLPEGTDLSRPSATPGERMGAHYVRLVAVNAQADIESITVHRDMYYIARLHGFWPGIPLGPNEYFALGDNGPSSSDGRAWGAVPEGNLMGRAFVVFWPGLPWNFRWRFIR
jgi:signal peptidase I